MFHTTHTMNPAYDDKIPTLIQRGIVFSRTREHMPQRIIPFDFIHHESFIQFHIGAAALQVYCCCQSIPIRQIEQCDSAFGSTVRNWSPTL